MLELMIQSGSGQCKVWPHMLKPGGTLHCTDTCKWNYTDALAGPQDTRPWMKAMGSMGQTCTQAHVCRRAHTHLYTHTHTHTHTHDRTGLLGQIHMIINK